MTFVARTLFAGLGIAAVIGSSASAEETIKIGVIRSVSNAALLVAQEKGYFKEVGI
jgi:ABC-type nitrate/sulfonate/bicarbonate transport system substrate-binding protein